MRTKFLSALLISSFLLSSLPLLAEEHGIVELKLPAEPAQKLPVIDDIPPVEPEVPAEPVEPLPEPAPEPLPEPVIETPESETATTSESVVETEPMPAPTASSVTSTIVEEGVPDPVPVVSFTIRYGEAIAWTGTTTAPKEGTVTVSSTGGSEEEIRDANSLLAVLLQIDADSDAVSLTDLDYYSSLDSFLLNCVSATAFAEACGQWQYVINGEYPSISIDYYALEDGDDVYLYFGQPRRVRLEDDDIHINEPFVAIAESYSPSDNSYAPFPNHTVGITVAGSWPQIEVATTTSGVDGRATFTVADAGSYEISLKMPSEWGDFYDYPPTQFTVSSSTEDGGSGGGESPTDGFDITLAFDFLTSGQNADGSWENGILTDWSALALAVSGAPSSAKSRLASFLRSDEQDVSSVQDHTRHAMALMALNINPYTGGPTDYIEPIVASFDGTQLDSPSIMNDDIFGLLVLMNAGFDTNDEIIQKITAFIVSEQNGNGSWENSVDVTAAAIQALAEVRSEPGVSSAMSRAESYLRSSQQSSGGYRDAHATSWVIQAIEALGDSPDTWKKGEKTPLTYLADSQQEDGGLTTIPDDYATRAWAVAYAIPAVKGLTWSDVLRDFKKPADYESSVDSEQSGSKSEESETATTTEEAAILPAPFVATSTMMISTTTPADASVIPPLLRDVPTFVATHEEAPAETEVATVTPRLPAAAIESGAWTWVKRFFSSLWSLVTGIFS